MADGFRTGWSRGTRESPKSTGKTALLRPLIGINAAKCTTSEQATCQRQLQSKTKRSSSRVDTARNGMHTMYHEFARGNCKAWTGAGIISRCDKRRLTTRPTHSRKARRHAMRPPEVYTDPDASNEKEPASNASPEGMARNARSQGRKAPRA